MKLKFLSIMLVISVFITACGGASSLTGDDVVAAFKAAGLEAETPRAMTADDYGLAPFVCTGTRFYIPSLGEDKGGRIYICENTDDRDALATYYTKAGQASAIFFSWVYTKGNVVVQINGDLPEDKATQYEAAIP